MVKEDLCPVTQPIILIPKCNKFSLFDRTPADAETRSCTPQRISLVQKSGVPGWQNWIDNHCHVFQASGLAGPSTNSSSSSAKFLSYHSDYVYSTGYLALHAGEISRLLDYTCSQATPRLRSQQFPIPTMSLNPSLPPNFKFYDATHPGEVLGGLSRMSL